jgi:hypothetical protein
MLWTSSSCHPRCVQLDFPRSTKQTMECQLHPWQRVPLSASPQRECARLCSDATRAAGAKSEGKHVKRENAATMKKHTCHVQDPKDVPCGGLKMKLEGFKRGKWNGILSMRVMFGLILSLAWDALPFVASPVDAKPVTHSCNPLGPPSR